MTGIAIVCATFLACFIVAAVMLERHKRYWQDRGVDAVVRRLEGLAATTQADTATFLAEHAQEVKRACSKLQTSADALVTSKSAIDDILSDAGKMSKSIEERFGEHHRRMVRIENKVGINL